MAINFMRHWNLCRKYTNEGPAIQAAFGGMWLITMFPPLEKTMGATIACFMVELLVREIRRHWVCRLAFRKMAVTFSTCSKSDEIRVRDICLHRFPPLKKKTKTSKHTHTQVLLHLPEGECYVSGMGLLALAGWVSQFEINFFFCIFALLRSWPIATLSVSFFNFQGR